MSLSQTILTQQAEDIVGKKLIDMFERSKHKGAAISDVFIKEDGSLGSAAGK